MGAFLFYLLKSGCCLVVFYIFFKLLMSRSTFFHFNRITLLVGLLGCTLLPLIELTTTEETFLHTPLYAIHEILQSTESVILNPEQMEDPILISEKNPEINSLNWIPVTLAFIYGVGALVTLIWLSLSTCRLIQLIRTSEKKQFGNYVLVIPQQPTASFSWGKYIVISAADYSQQSEEILLHEMMHLRNHHTLDLLFMQIFLLVYWFNPVVWLLKRELQEVHEFEADNGVINTGIDATKYQLLLVKKAVGTRLYSMANGFDHSKLKNRIGMMLKKRSNGWVRLRMLLAVPVAAGVVYAFAQPEMSEKQVLLQMELMTQDALLQDSIAESKLTEEIASMKQFFKEKSDAWWKHHRTPEGRYVWRTTQTHRLYMNGSNEVMFDTVVYKILTDPRQVIAGRLRSAREADRLEKKKDEPRFLYMVYDVNSDKRQVLGMLKEIKLAFDDLRAEYVAKGASDVDEVCPYMVYVYGPRKYGVNGAELLIGAAGAEPQERIHDITGNRLKSYQGRYGKNASVLLRVDNSVSERGYIEMCKRVKRYFPAAKTEHEK